MDVAQLKAALEKVDADSAKLGLPSAVGLPMVLSRQSCPRGDNVRTPFGMCKIMNTQMKDGLVQVVFYAPRNRIESYIKKAGAK